MVLSNKRLKQKFRSLLAESIASSESSKKTSKDSPKEGVNGELQSIRELLSSQSRKKPKPPQRKRRRKERPLAENLKAEDSEGTHIGNGENALNEGEKKMKKKKQKKKKKKEGGKVEEASDESKKRKREDEGDQGLIEDTKKKKKEKEKKKKEKVKKVEEKIEKASDSANTESNGERAEELVKIDESETKKVYVGGIPYYSSEDDIRSFFEGCGTVTEVDCMTFPESGKFRGIAILTFKTEAAAKRALALDGADMGGFYLKIQPYKPQRTQKPKPEFTPKIVDGYNRVYVGNLSWDITEDDLKHLFSDCKISSIRFGTNKETGDFKGYAHVDFEDTVSLTIALKLDQKVVCGRPVKISCAVPKKGVDINSQKKHAAKKAENGGIGGSAKKKRRTCYECGVPGHLSSACPRKKAAKVDGADTES